MGKFVNGKMIVEKGYEDTLMSAKEKAKTLNQALAAVLDVNILTVAFDITYMEWRNV